MMTSATDISNYEQESGLIAIADFKQGLLTPSFVICKAPFTVCVDKNISCLSSLILRIDLICINRDSDCVS